MSETPSRHIRFRGRSFPVLALEPEFPLPEWIERLDAHLAKAPGFFRGKSIVVDVTDLGLARSGVVGLMKDLSERGVSIMGLTGVERSWASPDLPPILTGGRALSRADRAPSKSAKAETDCENPGQLSPEQQDAFEEIARVLGGPTKRELRKGAAHKAAPLIVSAPVRSGQSISHPDGDVTVIGSVASGAEVIAGGSVHIYGTLRGRALAGAYGEMRSRIFCRRLEAELLAVGGVYITADEIEANVRSQPIQAWLENETVKIARLD